MSVIDLKLGGSSTTRVGPDMASDGDVLNLTALGSHRLVVDNVDVTIGGIAGVRAAARPTLAVTTDGSLTVDLSLLDSPGLTYTTFAIDGHGDITLDASAMPDADASVSLLDHFTVAYSGSGAGTFTYVPPPTGLSLPLWFEVEGMQSGDRFVLDGGRSWALGTLGLFGGPQTAYRDGALHLICVTIFPGQPVRVRIPMTRAEASIFYANQPAYLNGGVFTYPGNTLCYGDGALILTAEGYRPVETLVVGDRLRCADGRVRRLIWTAAIALDADALDLRPEMRPIRIAAGALAPGYPFSDLIVSPQHRIYVNGPAILEQTGGVAGLVAVRHLLGLPGIEPVPDWEKGVRYHHLLMEEHEILVANGLMSESLMPGPWSMRSLDRRTRKRLETLLPDFRRSMSGGDRSRHAVVKGQLVREALKRHGARREMLFNPVGARESVAG